MKPNISVIIPCYNQAEFLKEAVQSVLQQSYTNWECIIINDGSSDETEKISKKLLAKDPRIKYLFQENTGLSGARNTGIRLSEGKYILPLDADDKIGSDYLREAIYILESRSDVKIVYCEAEKFGKETGLWKLPEFNPTTFLFNNSIFCTAMYRRRDYDNTAGYNSNMKHGLEDWDLWLSLLETGGTVYKIPKIHFYYRIRENSMVRSLNEEKNQLLKTQIFLNHLPLYVSKFGDPLSIYYSNLKRENMINTIMSSSTYKIGKLILHPFIKCKILLNKIYKIINKKEKI